MQTFCFLPSSISNSVGLGPNAAAHLLLRAFALADASSSLSPRSHLSLSLALADSRSLSLSLSLSASYEWRLLSLNWIGVLENCTYKKCNRSSNVEAVKDEVFDNFYRAEVTEESCVLPNTNTSHG